MTTDTEVAGLEHADSEYVCMAAALDNARARPHLYRMADEERLHAELVWSTHRTMTDTYAHAIAETYARALALDAEARNAQQP